MSYIPKDMFVGQSYEPVENFDSIRDKIRDALRARGVASGVGDDALDVAIEVASYNAMALRDQEWADQLASGDLKRKDPASFSRDYAEYCVKLIVEEDLMKYPAAPKCDKAVRRLVNQNGEYHVHS